MKTELLKFALGVLVTLVTTGGCANPNLVPLQTVVLQPTPLYVTLKIKNWCPARFTDFYAKPMSYQISNGLLMQDFNRDGLADAEAINFGLSPFNGFPSGVTDFIAVEYMGLGSAGISSLPPCQNTVQASSGDLLTDCQKSALNLVPLYQYDPVGRGFPDSLAVLARLPLFDNTIATKDIAGDGMKTIEKLKANLRPDQFATTEAKKLAVKYEFQTNFDPKTNAACYDIGVTAPRAALDNGDLYNLYFLSADLAGVPSLKVKGVVVPPETADHAIVEYEYGKL